MKDIKAMIFDCDGVLFDSREANIKFYNHILARFKLPAMTEEMIEYVHMHTVDQSIEYLFKDTPYLEEAQRYRLHEMDYTPFLKEMVMEPGLREVLTVLKEKYKLAVATNRSTSIGHVLEEFGLSDFFDMVVSSLDVENTKPHPECVHKILQAFSLEPNEALYVGDSEIDAKTAQNAQVPFVAYKNASLPAQYHIESLTQILKILEIKNPGGPSKTSFGSPGQR